MPSKELLEQFMEQLQDEIQHRTDQGPHWPDLKHLLVDRWEVPEEDESREGEDGE